MDKPAPEDEKRHANMINSYPWNSQSNNFCMSRSDILLGKVDAAFGSDQSLTVAVDGVSPPNNPKKWPKAGRCLRVPKCVILSSLPYWVAYWKSGYFYAPRDILGTLLGDNSTRTGNYYYLDQWNDVDETSTDLETYGIDDPSYLHSAFWEQFDPPVSEEDKQAYLSYYQDVSHGNAPTGANTLSGPSTGPSVRYSQKVGTINNVYYSQHNQLLASFAIAKAQLESGPDPIYVTIPGWMNPTIHQKRNGYRNKGIQVRNERRGTGCDSQNAITCYDEDRIEPWAPPYPDVNDPRNQLTFKGCQVPWLASADPGFGTNTLHLYVGHSCVSYQPVTDVFGYQAYPFTPEGIYFGPVMLTNYLGAPLPYFAGMRAIWRDIGYDIGFIGPGGAGSVYGWYSALIEAAASTYKRNFWKYRNFGTRIFTYPQSNSVSWDLAKIWNDYKDECDDHVFYFGFTFAEWTELVSREDQRTTNCPGLLKTAFKTQKFPPAESLREALSYFLPPIRARVDSYYSSIEPGCAQVFQKAIEANDLEQYNVSYGGAGSFLLDPDAIVAYVREYFEENR